MKKTYTIILSKLVRDKMNIEKEISELLEYELTDNKKDRYQRLVGIRYYISDLIEFFEDIKNHLD